METGRNVKRQIRRKQIIHKLKRKNDLIEDLSAACGPDLSWNRKRTASYAMLNVLLCRYTAAGKGCERVTDRSVQLMSARYVTITQ